MSLKFNKILNIEKKDYFQSDFNDEYKNLVKLFPLKTTIFYLIEKF